MIEGIKLDFKSAELDDHLKARVQHHRERQEFYLERASMLKGAEDATSPGYSNSNRGNPIEQMESNAKSHEGKAALLEIIRTHLVAGEDYRLAQDDLAVLEFVPGRGW